MRKKFIFLLIFTSLIFVFGVNEKLVEQSNVVNIPNSDFPDQH